MSLDDRPDPPASAISARQAGLAFVRRANRWLIAGAVAFAGALTALTAHAFHPHTAAAATGSAAPRSDSAGAATTNQSDDNPGGVTAPQAAPLPAAPSAAPPVVSGGS